MTVFGGGGLYTGVNPHSFKNCLGNLSYQFNVFRYGFMEAKMPIFCRQRRCCCVTRREYEKADYIDCD